MLSRKGFFAATVFALFASVALAAVKTLTVEPATTRVDGSVLTLDEIDRHQIECRRPGGEWGDVIEVEMPLLVAEEDFAPGQWECRAYTVDTHDQISDPGAIVPFGVTPARPSPPALVVR